MATLITDIAGVSYDAVFESEVIANLKKTSYTIESGAEVVDHTIVEPIRYTVTAAVSNIVLGFSGVGMASGSLSKLTNSGIGSLVSGASSLSIGSKDRVSSIMIKLADLFAQRNIYTINTGELILQNMILVSYQRSKKPDTQGALFVDLVLEELATIDLISTRSSAPTQEQLHQGDPSQTQATSALDKGRLTLREADSQVTKKVSELSDALGGLF